MIHSFHVRLIYTCICVCGYIQHALQSFIIPSISNSRKPFNHVHEINEKVELESDHHGRKCKASLIFQLYLQIININIQLIQCLYFTHR